MRDTTPDLTTAAFLILSAPLGAALWYFVVTTLANVI